MVEYMIFPAEHFLCTWDDSIPLLLDKMICMCLLGSLVYSIHQILFSHWFVAGVFYLLLKTGFWSFLLFYCCIFYHFFPSFPKGKFHGCTPPNLADPWWLMRTNCPFSLFLSTPQPTHWKKTLVLGKTESKRRKWWQRMRWLNSNTNSRDMSLGKIWEIMRGREPWHAAVYGVTKSHTTWLLNNNNYSQTFILS